MAMQPGAGPLTFNDGLRKAREALDRVLLGAHVQPPTRSRIGISIATKAAVTAIVLSAAAALRFALGTHGIGFSSAIFFPAILFCTLYAGWQYGVAAWIGSTIIVWLMVRAGIVRGDPGIAVFAVSGAVQTAIAGFARAMLLDREILRHRLLKLVDASQGFAFITDGKGRPIEPHARWMALTGMTWEAYRNYGWLEAIHPDDRNQLPLLELPGDAKSYLLELRIREGASGEWRWHRLRTLPVRGPDGEIREWVGTLDDIHEGKLETERREIVVSELRHRLKNLMAIVEALAKYSAPRPGVDQGVDNFLKRFTGRLRALTAASDLVLAGPHGTIETSDVIRATLAPFMSDLSPRIVIDGPALLLSEELGGGLALAVHELATNAIKYGALSAPQGSVSFTWTMAPAPEGDHVAFDWKERGGPAPQKPNRDGFGIRMIKAVTAREKNGAVTIDFEPDGLRCRISFIRMPAKPRDA